PENIRKDFPALVRLLRIRKRGSSIIVPEDKMTGRRHLHPDLRAIFLGRIAPGLWHVIETWRTDRNLDIRRHLPTVDPLKQFGHSERHHALVLLPVGHSDRRTDRRFCLVLAHFHPLVHLTSIGTLSPHLRRQYCQ